MGLEVPVSLKSAHEALHAAVRRAMQEHGQTGEIARRVAQLLDGHMLREEKFVFKPLGLLPALARGETPWELAEAERIADGLKREVGQMRDEHRQLADAMRQLAGAAEAEGKSEYVALAEDLIVHTRMEEEVLYPAAMLVGEYAKRVRGG